MINYFLNHENDYISIGFVVTTIVCGLIGVYAIFSALNRLISNALGTGAWMVSWKLHCFGCRLPAHLFIGLGARHEEISRLDFHYYLLSDRVWEVICEDISQHPCDRSRVEQHRIEIKKSRQIGGFFISRLSYLLRWLAWLARWVAGTLLLVPCQTWVHHLWPVFSRPYSQP